MRHVMKYCEEALERTQEGDTLGRENIGQISVGKRVMLQKLGRAMRP